MASLSLLTLTVVLLVSGGVHASNILVIPFYHYSHVNLFGIAGTALAADGHNVTLMVSSKFAGSPAKFNLKPLVYQLSKDTIFTDKVSKFKERKLSLGLISDLYNEFLPIIGKVCEQVLGNEDFMAAIRNEKFDLVLLDGVPLVHCFYIIPYKLGIPYISINAALDPWSLGIPASAALEPVQTFPIDNHLSFVNRLQVAAFYAFLSYVPPYTCSSSYFVRKYAPEKPEVTSHQLYRKSDMFLVNHEVTCVDYPRISAPHYQFIGGSSARPARPLPDDLEDFVSGAPDGVIVVSFGSMPAWQTIWKNVKAKMIYALGRLPQRAVILYSLDDDTADFPPNTRAMKWLPQNDLLGHPNTRLFISHGGNNGQLETTFHGVPILVLPIVGDQVYNGIRAESHGQGRLVQHWDMVTGDELLATITEMLSNESYTLNARKCSRIIRSQPSTQERIVFWVNHVLEFGSGDHLHPPHTEMPLYRLLMLDIAAFVILISILNLVLFVLCCRCFIRKCCIRKEAPKEKRA